MKKKIKLIIKIIIIFIIILILLSIPNITNNNYHNNLIKKIEKETKQKINNLNKYNKYYIVTTDNKIIVYDINYQEIFIEDLDKIAKLNYDIIYKKGTLMYEEKSISKHKVIYTYYDIHTKEKIDSLEIEENNDK